MTIDTTNGLFLEPGHVCFPGEPICVWGVAGSGIIITLFDKEKRFGGMAHYLKPEGSSDAGNSPIFAKPAILGLLKLMKGNGATIENLVASMYGAAENPKAPGYIKKLNENNVRIARKILKKLKISIAGCDVGGHWGRKVAFHSSTGESVVVKTEKIRKEDWYPSIS